MTSRLVLKAAETSSKSGVNYVCADCGTVLYHTGVDGVFEGGEPGFPSRQPHEVTENLRTCPACGHKLNPQPDPDTIRVTIVNHNQSAQT
jgi:DNA-directed RNA polymerase subunit RPC12/RpoP